MKHLKSAFTGALSEEGITKQVFARQRNIPPTQVSKFLHSANSLTPQMKRCIFKGWNNPAIPITLFDAHIQDEIEAAGLSVRVILDTTDPSGETVDERSKVIKDLRGIIEGSECIDGDGEPTGFADMDELKLAIDAYQSFKE